MILAALFASMSVVVSTVVVFPNMAPFQHFFNVIGAVYLGPFYNFISALITGLIRMGTGRPFTSVTGAVFGALLSGLMYKHTKKYYMAVVGEIIGTGIISAIVSYYAMKYLFDFAHLDSPFYYIPFFIPSAAIGAVLGYIVLKIIRKK